MTRELLVDSSPEEHRVVVLEDGRPAEILIERSGERRLGNIYLGRIDKVIHASTSRLITAVKSRPR